MDDEDVIIEGVEEIDWKSYWNWTDDYLNELDTSEYPFPNILWHIRPLDEVLAKTIATVLIAVPGMYLNLVILIVLAKNKWLWSPSNFLVGNLAFVDFIILLTCPWLTLVRDIYQSYVLGEFMCHFEGFLQATLLLANVGAVLLVSYDRLAAAALNTDARVTRSAVPKLIAGSWLASVSLATPWIVKSSYVERQWLDYLEQFCSEDRHFLSIYWHFVLIILVWIPLGAMVVTYGTIMWRLQKTVRELSSRGGGQAVSKVKGKAFKVTACVLLADVICRIPYSVMIYMRDRNDLSINSVDGGFAIIWFLAQYLMYVNCAINPLIYGFTNTRFRKAMDRTPGIACCRFGSWCCICVSFQKQQVRIEDKNTEKIFVIESSPKPDKKLSKLIKNMLHIQKDAMDLKIPNVDEGSTKPTKVTPLKPDVIIRAFSGRTS